MKTLRLLWAIVISGVLFTSCNRFNDEIIIIEPSLEEVVSGYDLWYVDYHRTVGVGDIPFVSRAFTLSFVNGVLYANNNIVDIGFTGNGFGIDVGTYNTFNGFLETDHDIDGYHDFDVTVLSNNEIRLYNYQEDVNYYLIGYNVNNFDYDQLFYDNIEYFLQEYVAWEKVDTQGGSPNAFDDENYLQFTPENLTTFYSSQDLVGTNVDFINWNFVGAYEVFDVNGYDDLKILTLNYDNGDIEEFELSVTNDSDIRLYHISTGTVYDFTGRGFLLYLKGQKKVADQQLNRNENRKRTIVKRKAKDRKHK